jgi:Ca-activated chloride channel family protein
MTFRNATLLWFLAAMPLALGFLLLRERFRRSVANRFTSERIRGLSNPWRALRPWLLGLALAAAVVALAGPYAGFTVVPIVAREANRVLVIDVSNSMAAEDVGASRLAAAKAIAKRLTNAQPGRVALVVFEGSPDVVSPLTTDTDAVVALLDTLDTGEVGEPGSDIGNAVLGALRLIEADPAQKADIVVMSDGEEQGSRVGEAIARAKQRGVAVSTVLIGTAQGSSIPTERGPLRDAGGEIVTTHASAGVLREVAAGTGGTLLENPFGEHAIDPLLDRTPAGQLRQTQARVPIERYQWPLGAAFLLFLLGSFVHRGAE